MNIFSEKLQATTILPHAMKPKPTPNNKEPPTPFIYSSYNDTFDNCLSAAIENLDYQQKLYTVTKDPNNKQLLRAAMKLEFLLHLRDESIANMTHFHYIHDEKYPTVFSRHQNIEQMMLSELPICTFPFSTTTTLKSTPQQTMVLLKSLPEGDFSLYLSKLLNWFDAKLKQRKQQKERYKNYLALILFDIYQKYSHFNQHLVTLDLKEAMYRIFDFSFCEKVIGIKPLTPANINKLNKSDWMLLKEDENAKIIENEYDAKILRLEERVKEYENMMNANNWNSFNTTDKSLIHVQCQLLKQRIQEKRKKKDKKLKECMDRKHRIYKKEVINGLNKYHSGNTTPSSAKIATTDMIEFIVDMEQSNIANWSTHPRRQEMVVLLELEKKKNGKLNYSHYHLYQLLYIAVSQRIINAQNKQCEDARSFLCSFIAETYYNSTSQPLFYAQYAVSNILSFILLSIHSTVKYQEVKNYFNNNKDSITDLIFNTVWDSKTALMDTSSIKKLFKNKLDVNGMIVDVSFKRYSKSYYIKRHPNKEYCRQQKYDALFNYTKYQSEHKSDLLIVSSDELTTLKSDHTTSDKTRRPGSVCLSFNDLIDGEKEEYVAVTDYKVRGSSEFMERSQFQKVTSHTIMKPTIGFDAESRKEVLLRTGCMCLMFFA